MSIDVYADESGIHDPTGKEPGSNVAALAGLVAWREDWINFRRDWQAKLLEYNVPYFHYREWFYEKNKKNSPYFGWDEQRLNSFRDELAEIAGKWRRFYIGGYFNVKKYHGLAPKAYPYTSCFRLFFNSFLEEANDRWPWCRDSFTFIFDDTTDKLWKEKLHDVFSDYKQIDSRISQIRFGDKKVPDCLPLQAADMLVYRIRHLGEKKIEIGNPLVIKEDIDRALFEKSMPSRYNYAIRELAAISATL